MGAMHVFVTGSSSGIGEALVREYAKLGVSLTMVARRRPLLDAIADDVRKTTKATLRVVDADLGDPDAAVRVLDEAEAELGPVDVLVNNAGVQIVGATTKTPWDAGEQLLRLNVLTPLKLTHHVLPKMIARGAGTIVDIASMAALAPTPGMFFYNASKAALAAASEGLRGELRGSGVHVVTVYPGPVRTPLEERGRAALNENVASKYTPTGDADVLARMILAAVDRKHPRVIYPRVYGISRHFPNATRWMLDRFTPAPKALPSAR